MATKMHIRRNVLSANPGIALCGTDPYKKGVAGGPSVLNKRASYMSIPQSHIVHIDTWLVLKDEQRCQHCHHTLLLIRNRQRAAHGLPPVNELPKPRVTTA